MPVNVFLVSLFTVAGCDDQVVKQMCMTSRWSLLCHHLTSQIDALVSTNPVAVEGLILNLLTYVSAAVLRNKPAS